jgi:inner membrane organizing system protein 1
MATRPPELSMDAKWEAAIDLTLRRLVYGSLAGGAAGLMLFRASPSRLHTERPGVHPPASPVPIPRRLHRSLGLTHLGFFSSADCSRQFESLGLPKLPPKL